MKRLQLLCLIATAGLMACGGTTQTTLPGGPGDGGAGGNAQCAHDPPGKTFSFHIHNAGTRMLSLAYGCNNFPTFYAMTKQGKLPLTPAPGSLIANGFTCDSIFDGAMSQGAYGDCGPGYGANLGPGVTVDLTWDRRGYQAFDVPAECSGHATNNDCWLGIAIEASTMQAGELDICSDATSGGASGYCSSPETVAVTFDTTGDEATIDVM